MLQPATSNTSHRKIRISGRSKSSIEPTTVTHASLTKFASRLQDTTGRRRASKERIHSHDECETRAADNIGTPAAVRMEAEHQKAGARRSSALPVPSKRVKLERNPNLYLHLNRTSSSAQAVVSLDPSREDRKPNARSAFDENYDRYMASISQPSSSSGAPHEHDTTKRAPVGSPTNTAAKSNVIKKKTMAKQKTKAAAAFEETRLARYRAQ